MYPRNIIKPVIPSLKPTTAGLWKEDELGVTVYKATTSESSLDVTAGNFYWVDKLGVHHIWASGIEILETAILPVSTPGVGDPLVAINTATGILYTYNPIDGEWQPISDQAPTNENIYNINGSLTGDRTLNGLDSHSLTFDNITNFSVNAAGSNIYIDDLSNTSFTNLSVTTSNFGLLASNMASTEYSTILFQTDTSYIRLNAPGVFGQFEITSNLIKLEHSVALAIKTPNVVGSTATVGQVLTLQDAATGKVEYANNVATNIYTDDGTLDSNRIVEGNNQSLTFNAISDYTINTVGFIVEASDNISLTSTGVLSDFLLKQSSLTNALIIEGDAVGTSLQFKSAGATEFVGDSNSTINIKTTDYGIAKQNTVHFQSTNTSADDIPTPRAILKFSNDKNDTNGMREYFRIQHTDYSTIETLELRTYHPADPTNTTLNRSILAAMSGAFSSPYSNNTFLGSFTNPSSTAYPFPTKNDDNIANNSLVIVHSQVDLFNPTRLTSINTFDDAPLLRFVPRARGAGAEELLNVNHAFIGQKQFSTTVTDTAWFVGFQTAFAYDVARSMLLYSDGDLRLGAYADTRDDASSPINFLSTDVNGYVQSHPIGDIINDKSTVVPVLNDVSLFSDTSDSGNLKKNTLEEVLKIKPQQFIYASPLMGASPKLLPLGLDFQQVTTTFALSDQLARFIPYLVPSTMDIEGVWFYQSTQGNYTGDEINGMALYSYDGAGNLTKVAETTNDANFWKGASSTWIKKAFSAVYTAAPGMYWVEFVYNYSAQITAPVIGAVANGNTAAMNALFTNSVQLHSSKTAQITFAATHTMASLTGQLSRPFVMLY